MGYLGAGSTVRHDEDDIDRAPNVVINFAFSTTVVAVDVVESGRLTLLDRNQYSSCITSSDLMIPGKFVRKYGEKLKLSKLAFLKVPSGAVWQVELSNSRGHVWLHNGWKEFMKYYSISYGHFLVFQYNGNSIFHVLIFDKSASEIEYPSGQTNQKWDFQIPETEDVELDDSVEILDDFLTCQGTFEKDGSVEILNDPPTCKRRKMMRTNLTCKTKNDSNLHSRGIQSKEGKLANLNEDVTREIKKECTQGMHTAQGRLPSQVPDRRKSVNVDHRFRARQRAKGFESKNPFFMVYMQPSYLRPKQSLHIPLDFAKKYFSGKQSGVILRVSDGRTWSAQFYGKKRGPKHKLGWISFARDNNILAGDVCVFEMMMKSNIEPPLLNVMILRAAEDWSVRKSVNLKDQQKVAESWMGE
ncbi:hypothetical protein TEA_008236 [Camellia sinensis var. sinensis]|uniref:TF-B3 domain-containing protein n=1 Tax=Camellia sinensis var. sinensis TaxID=542762 RepID=A0A4S4EB22_CAMSN|nr:hypothetical protein TEA_008236 [Camellia sinensis var. sinensis]